MAIIQCLGAGPSLPIHRKDVLVTGWLAQSLGQCGKRVANLSILRNSSKVFSSSTHWRVRMRCSLDKQVKMFVRKDIIIARTDMCPVGRHKQALFVGWFNVWFCPSSRKFRTQFCFVCDLNCKGFPSPKHGVDERLSVHDAIG